MDNPITLAVTDHVPLTGKVRYEAQVLIELQPDRSIIPLLEDIAAKDGPIPIVQAGGAGLACRADWLLEEVSVSIDTTAAGGNASLMALA